MKTETLDDDGEQPQDDDGPPRPGIVIVHSGDRPVRIVLPFAEGARALEVGRDDLAAAGIPDVRVSRRHVRVELEGDGWTVRDLGSRNGIFVDGRLVPSGRHLTSPVVRIGRTILLPVLDHTAFASLPPALPSAPVMGPLLHRVHERVALIARSGAHLLILGESGAGKELCAQAFHAAGPGGASRPFVAVNCATIQKDLAEGMLFGARRGAYTGAVADAPGLVQAAHGGTLFLDEIAELDPGVQAKLLRVLETKAVTPLGAVTPVEVNSRLCAATHKDLRLEVAEGRFRGDLYFRIGRPGVRLPPLRDRRDEIPWLIDRALASPPPGVPRLAAGAEIVEAALLRPWPGNVRELMAETTTAAVSAMAAHRTSLLASDLDDEAGRAIDPADEAQTVTNRPGSPALDADAIEAALRAEQGNVARAAARLGVTRSRVRRFIEREGIDVRAMR